MEDSNGNRWLDYAFRVAAGGRLDAIGNDATMK
jgi:hypothetical protein